MKWRTILVAGLLLARSAHAEAEAVATAATAAEMLEQAGFALLEAEGARDRVTALTLTVRAYEEGLTALRDGIRHAALRERAILTVFDAERDRLGRLLAVLQSIEAAPVPLMLLHPEGPMGTARSGMIVADVTPAVAAEARAVRTQLQELAALRTVQETALADLAAALDHAQEARTQLSQAIADRGDLPENFTRDQAAMNALLGGMDQLEAIADVLEADATATDASGELPDFAASRGTLPLPVLGTPLRGFREADGAGVIRPGLVTATEPRALVTAPWPGRVRYAGPLPDYGNVIILEPEGGYLLINAGLGTLYVAVGALVAAGAPLGMMPGGAEPDSEDLIAAASQGGSARLTETLYIELRENGVPVDPALWFTETGPDRDEG